ncbi:MAG TPA: hypothetical protein VIY48_08930, partial [Candidatus Paceibacterota bacterium]
TGYLQSVSWGDIGGNITLQSDLQSALAGKLSVTGNAVTATALQNPPSILCASGEAARGVNAYGNSVGCWAVSPSAIGALAPGDNGSTLIGLTYSQLTGTPVFSVPEGGTGNSTIAENQIFIGSALDTLTTTTIPNCPDDGSHLNYNSTTHEYSCGTSGGTVGSAAFNTLTSGANSQATMTVDTGAALIPSGSGSIIATALSAQYLDWNASTGPTSIANKPTIASYPSGTGIPISNNGAWGTTLTPTDNYVVVGAGGVWSKSNAPAISGANIASSSIPLASLASGTLTQSTSGSAATLSGSLTACTAGNLAIGILANGNANCVNFNPNSYSAASVGQAYYIGTTPMTLNRPSGAQTLTGINIDGSAGSVTWSNVSSKPNLASSITCSAGYKVDTYNSTTGAFTCGPASTGSAISDPTGTNANTSNLWAWDSSDSTQKWVSSFSMDFSDNSLIPMVLSSISGTCTDNQLASYPTATSGQRIYLCESGTWQPQAGGGSGSMTWPGGNGLAVVANGNSWGTTIPVGTLTDGRLLKYTTASGIGNATSGTDFAPATSGTALLKANGSGGFSAAVAGTDYVAPGGGTVSNPTGTYAAVANVYFWNAQTAQQGWASSFDYVPGSTNKAGMPLASFVSSTSGYYALDVAGNRMIASNGTGTLSWYPQGTLTDTRYCTWNATSKQIDCNNSGTSAMTYPTAGSVAISDGSSWTPSVSPTNGYVLYASGGTWGKTNSPAISGANMTASTLPITAIAPSAWKLFYSNGSSIMTELTLGAAGTVLQSSGATSAPTFTTPSSLASSTTFTITGDVTGTGLYSGITTTITKIGGKTATLGGTLSTANTFSTTGAYSINLTATGATSVTLPTSGTLATSTDALANMSKDAIVFANLVSTGSTTIDVYVPWAGTITSSDVFCQATSTISAAIYTAPTNTTTFTKISASDPVTLSGAQTKATVSGGGSGWTTSFSAGYWFRAVFNGMTGGPCSIAIGVTKSN